MMGYVQDATPLKRAKKSAEEMRKFEALAGIAPSLAMQKEALDMIMDEKNKEAEKFRTILSELEKIDAQIKSTPWDANVFLKADEMQLHFREGHEFDIEGFPYSMPTFMKESYIKIAQSYKIIARQWGINKEKMLDEAAMLLRTSMTAKNGQERRHIMNELLLHNGKIKQFLLDVVLKGYKTALMHIQAAEEMFKDIGDKMFD